MVFVSVCTFKRTRRSDLEYGVAIGSDESSIQTIVDARGDRVGTLYDYTCTTAYGCFTADLPADGMAAKVQASKDG
jgi:hypothetical protein